ncbi:phasin [Chelatococcus daeguensis]|uniref:Phasin n=2 Tax=Chelatococcus TaxID=28209 RepID=A0AAC9JMP4_9HYPH|nr:MULTISPECIES: phasin [Chelatococcus]APF36558.1 phasin [Chelatococcus daeguensis]KZE33783.1 phasin [Chelatococcus daeguensis]MBM3082863.1 phasin [Chelatococcus daeguensis]CUA89694.1 phasin [Chelatococcus sambhunathii]
MDAKDMPNYEIPAEMRDFAERSVEQARKAFDGFIAAAQRAVTAFEGSATTVQSSTQDLTHRTLSFAEQNIAAAFDLAQKLVRAKDMQEAMQLQADYLQKQLASLQAQMKEFGFAAEKAVGEATKRKA